MGLPASRLTCAMRAWMQEIGSRETGTRRLQAKTGKAVKNDFGELVEIADEESEEANIERLPDEAGDDVSPARAQKRPASVITSAISVEEI